MSIHAPQATTEKWRTVEPAEQCRRWLHHKPFRLAHGLAGHPLFSIPALVEVAKAAAKRPGDLYADAGNVKVTDKWGHIPIPDRPVDEIINRIENAGAWIIMKHVETDPRYAAVLNDLVEFVRALSDPAERHLLNNPEMLVLITSPNRITSFHFDAEVNFLVQVQGSKDVWVCDPLDRATVTEQEIERYYTGHQNAGTYKPGVEERATHFLLSAGEAVHIPTHGAHWVKNSNAISISLSLNFELPPSMYKYASITNYGLRRIGLQPAPPNGSGVVHQLKATAGGLVFNTHRLLKSARKGFRS